MTEAIFGLIGVLIGSAISWVQTYWFNNHEKEKSAKYLAIRVVCILDKYMEDCAGVIRDRGVPHILRVKEQLSGPQPTAQAPNTPVFPDDIDWKSIDHDLMYKILSFPADIEAGNNIAQHAYELAKAPNYEDFFDERAFWHAKFGLIACSLIEELCKKYAIPMKTYNSWDPKADFMESLQKFEKLRIDRMKRYEAIRIQMNAFNLGLG